MVRTKKLAIASRRTVPLGLYNPSPGADDDPNGRQGVDLGFVRR